MKRAILGIFVLLLGYAAYEYGSSPQFWKRYVRGFLSGGEGAYSKVFDFQEEVRPSSDPYEIPTAPSPSILADALDNMRAYAIEYDSFALLVVHNGQVQFEWYTDGYDRQSLTQSQSMHKSLQALLVGIAVDRGLIASIDDPIASYVPELAVPGGGDATIRDYLAMSSGMQPFRAGFSPWGEAFRWLYSDDINAATLVIPRNLPSGESFTYHDATTQAIGMLLTSVFDKRYGDYLADLVWEPLGARRAWVWLDSEDGTAHHNCCLLATARDWAKLGLLFANRGEIAGRRIVSADWIDLQTSESLIPHYGFQTWLATNDSVYPLKGTGLRQEQDWLDEDAFFFSGYGGQRVYVSPNHQLVVVRLGPAAGYFPKFANEWDNAFLLNTAIRGLQPANVPPARMP